MENDGRDSCRVFHTCQLQLQKPRLHSFPSTQAMTAPEDANDSGDSGKAVAETYVKLTQAEGVATEMEKLLTQLEDKMAQLEAMQEGGDVLQFQEIGEQLHALEDQVSALQEEHGLFPADDDDN